MIDPTMDLFVVAAPGLEPDVAAEVRALLPGKEVTVLPGGVACTGGWAEVARLNLWLRSATRVLARLAQFRAAHLAQLDKRARKVPWATLLRPDVPLRVEAVCRRSRIYHQGAAAERIGRAITDTVGAPVVAEAAAARLTVKARIDDDLCTLSLDTSGEPLHRRGHKQAVGKAPLRETLAAAFLARCGYDRAEPVVDPMCGSGTFVIEAAEMAAGLAPGRARRFAFEEAAAGALDGGGGVATAAVPPAPYPPRYLGFDRDAGAVIMATANADRAGLAGWSAFAQGPISAFAPPHGPPGLIMVNPPYGARIGNRRLLFGLYGAFGEVMRACCRGWRVGLVTSDAGLANATGLPFLPPEPPVDLGGLKVTLYRTGLL